MDALYRDLRLAVRTLMRSPGFALAAITTLGLGIGATTLVFSLVNGILMRPFPFEQPNRLVQVAEVGRDGADGLSYPDFVDYRAGMRALSGLAAYANETFTVRGAALPERVEGARVSWNLFSIIGVEPILGRSFRLEEDRPNAERAALIGYGLWQRAFGGSPDVIGKVVRIEGDPHTVVGVMPPGFKFPRAAEAWLPFRRDPNTARGHRFLDAIGRLAPVATIARAQADAAAVEARLDREYSRRVGDWVAQVSNLQEVTVRATRPVLLIMFAAVGFVLLIACANVANLLLSRASSRDREFAIRTALGAGRWRLVRQLLTENALLGLGGGVLGILLAAWWLDLILATIPAAMPYWLRLEIDRSVLLFTLAISLATAFIFGLAPALQSARTDVQTTLKEGRGTTASRDKNRLRSALVVVQLTLAIVLLTGGLLMVRSFLAMRRVNPGFQVDNVAAVDLSLPGTRYEPVEARLAFYERLLERMSAISGIERVAGISNLPIGGA
ncbi:MAG TPA: ABC transporter permease, partial [Longimicrobiales bacterium]|nr:ABC transporter permease [Longimicrobiales bacterium]